MEEMTLRVPVAVKAKVTEDLKAKIVSDLETRLDMVNKDLEAIELLKDAQELTLGTEIPQGTLEQTVTVKIGDNLDAMMGAEILLEDGKIVAFRQ